MEFSFKARTRTGTIQEGVIDAISLSAAIESLQGNDLIIISIEPAKKRFKFAIPFLRRVKTQDLVSFSRQLAVMFSAKSPLVDALRAIGEETENETFHNVILDVAKDVEAGLSLSRALGRYPNIFDDFFVNLVRAGENVGKLEDTLNYIADYLERQYDLIKKAKGALTYPIFIVIGLIIAGAVLLTFVIPQITSILEETGQELPFLTLVIIGLSNFVRDFWYLVFSFLIFFLFGVWYYFARTQRGQIQWDHLQIKIPILKDIFKKIYLTRIAESLNTLIVGGLPILQALDVTADVVGNVVYREVLHEAAETTKRGGSISTVLKRYPDVIPHLFSQMVAVGETSGKLDFVLEKTGSFYQKEVTSIMDNLVNLIEPILILVLGAGVGVLIVAILLPIYSISTAF
ncbi:type II secretion system F family protein [Candidatus Parcubacteria bacterium]|nr:MAG: type II secretion system F family protein [Candidatus Parcubacteria bacterium]